MEQQLKCHSCDKLLDEAEIKYGGQECEECEISSKAERLKVLLDRLTDRGYQEAFMKVLRTLMGH